MALIPVLENVLTEYRPVDREYLYKRLSAMTHTHKSRLWALLVYNKSSSNTELARIIVLSYILPKGKVKINGTQLR